jgi:hypothetical protein
VTIGAQQGGAARPRPLPVLEQPLHAQRHLDQKGEEEEEGLVAGLPTWGIFPLKSQIWGFFGLWRIRGFLGEF